MPRRRPFDPEADRGDLAPHAGLPPRDSPRIYVKTTVLLLGFGASCAAGSWLRRWLLDPLGRIVARLEEAFGRVIANRKRRRASPDYSVRLNIARGPS
jgi:hypothetical protein